MEAATVLFAVVVLSVAAVSGSSRTLMLERAFSLNHVELSQLRAWDVDRHRRMLQSTNNYVDFPVKGSIGLGIYYTKVRLGTPPKEFNVQIDTGSDDLWVNCVSCNGCPQTSALQIQLNYFDPKSSSSSSVISCSDQRCKSSCNNNQCIYTFNYGDKSGTSGYYVSDLVHLSEGSLMTNSSVVFGCSNLQIGGLTKSHRALDGILGFGQQEMSFISQLTAQGIAPRVFSHCFKGGVGGGGILVLGEILEPNMIYTPIDPLEKQYYSLNLYSISINGQILPFEFARRRDTILDSGSTLAYLVKEAYDPFVNAITAAIPQSVHTVLSGGSQCYLMTTSVDIFPQVSLNFDGGASLVLKPHDYLIQKNYIRSYGCFMTGMEGSEHNFSSNSQIPTEILSSGNGSMWCIGIQEYGEMNILGDIVLKDKIFVYDLARQRIGWSNYNCSLPVNISGTGRGDERSGSTLRDGPDNWIKTWVFALLLTCCFVFF